MRSRLVLVYVALEFRRRRFAAAAPLAVCAALTLLLNAVILCPMLGSLRKSAGYRLNRLWISEQEYQRQRSSTRPSRPRRILSNLIRNTATHFHVTPSVTVNLAVEDAVVRLHESLGAGCQRPTHDMGHPDVPRTCTSTRTFSRTPVRAAAIAVMRASRTLSIF